MLRVYKSIFILLSFIPCIGQESAFPQIKLQSAYTGANPYLELLSIADNDALIIKAARNQENTTEEGSYLALLCNGKIHRYGIYSIKGEIVVKHSTVHEAEKQFLYAAIQKANVLDQSQLDRKDIPAADDRTSLYVNDADTYYLTIYKNDRFSHFQSEAPYEYIEAKVQGYEMRSVFLDLFNALDFKRTIRTMEINEIRTSDTVYVYYQKGPYESKMTSTQTGLGFYQIAINNREQFIFNEIKNDSPGITDKAGLQHIRDVMIDYDFLFKYGAEAQFLRSKKVFIVDALELSQNKVKLKEVKVIFLFSKI